MANKNIKEVEGGEVTTLSDASAFEIDTGAASVFISWLSLREILFAIIPNSGMMLNGKISVTVVSGDLVLELKTLAGTDPSATDKVFININSRINY